MLSKTNTSAFLPNRLTFLASNSGTEGSQTGSMPPDPNNLEHDLAAIGVIRALDVATGANIRVNVAGHVKDLIEATRQQVRDLTKEQQLLEKQGPPVSESDEQQRIQSELEVGQKLKESRSRLEQWASWMGLPAKKGQTGKPTLAHSQKNTQDLTKDLRSISAKDITTEQASRLELSDENYRGYINTLRKGLSNKLESLLTLDTTEQEFYRLEELLDSGSTLIRQIGKAVGMSADDLELIKGYLLKTASQESKTSSHSVITFLHGLLTALSVGIDEVMTLDKSAPIPLKAAVVNRLKREFEQWHKAATSDLQRFTSEYLKSHPKIGIAPSQAEKIMRARTEEKLLPGNLMSQRLGLLYANLEVEKVAAQVADLKKKRYLALQRIKSASPEEANERLMLKEELSNRGLLPGRKTESTVTVAQRIGVLENELTATLEEYRKSKVDTLENARSSVLFGSQRSNIHQLKQELAFLKLKKRSASASTAEMAKLDALVEERESAIAILEAKEQLAVNQNREEAISNLSTRQVNLLKSASAFASSGQPIVSDVSDEELSERIAENTKTKNKTLKTLKKISKSKTPSQAVEIFIAKQEASAMERVISLTSVPGNPSATKAKQLSFRQKIEYLKATDPNFNVFEYVTKVEKENENPKQLLHGEKLAAIRRLISQVQEIVNRPKIDALAEADYSRLMTEINKQMGGPKAYRQKMKALASLPPSATPEQREMERQNALNNALIVAQYERAEPFKLPTEDEQLLNSLTKKFATRTILKKRFPKMSALLEQVGSAGSNSPRQVVDFFKTALEEIWEKMPTSVRNALAKLLSCDDLITKYRFDARTGELFCRLSGSPYTSTTPPKTFLARSREIMRALSDAASQNDLVAMNDIITKLLKPLRSDAIFFPTNRLKSKGPEREKDLIHIKKNTREKIDLDDKAMERSLKEFETPKQGESNELAMAKGERIFDSKEHQENITLPPEEVKESLAVSQLSGSDAIDEIEALQSTAVAAGSGGKKYKGSELEKRQREAAGLPKLPDDKDNEHSAKLKAKLSEKSQKLRQAMRLPQSYLMGTWKDLEIYNTMSLLMVIGNAYTQIAARTDFYNDMMANRLGQTIFKGTFVEAEFRTKYQNAETERMNFYREAMKQFGNDQVRDILMAPTDMFELKAAFVEMAERGTLLESDFRLPEVCRSLNKFSSVRVPVVSIKRQKNNHELQYEITEKAQEAVDALWGTGTARGYQQQAVSAMESKTEDYKKTASGQNPKQKEEKYASWYEMLASGGDQGKEKLMKRMHPAEVMGYIKQDIEQGDNDHWQSLGLLQILVIEEVVSLDMLRRIQSTSYVNDVPIHAVLEKSQADLCGLTEFYEQCKKDHPSAKDFSDEKNPFFNFYYGRQEIPLYAKWNSGKWTFPKSQKEVNDARKEKNWVKTGINIRDFQFNRQAQPQGFKKMDNAHARIFASAYDYQEWEANMHEDNNGIIQDVRNHDMCSMLAGYTENFSSKIKAAQQLARGEGDYAKLLPQDRQIEFNRMFARAYKALAKAHGVVQKFNRHMGRKDFRLNPDGSPDTQSGRQGPLTNNKTGSSNYQRQILSIHGVHQRMNAASKILEQQIDDTQLLVATKRMVGMQYISEQGVDERTGRKGRPEKYTTTSFDPSNEFAKAFPLLLRYFGNLVRSNPSSGLTDEINGGTDQITAASQVEQWAKNHAFNDL